jgi:hypothetical protein
MTTTTSSTTTTTTTIRQAGTATATSAVAGAGAGAGVGTMIGRKVGSDVILCLNQHCAAASILKLRSEEEISNWQPGIRLSRVGLRRKKEGQPCQ